MGMKKLYTVKSLFRRFAVSLIVLLTVALLVPILLQTVAIHMGLTTSANQSELKVRAIIPTLTVAPDITKVVMPQGCRYLILDKNFNELSSNMAADEKEAALSYAKGEYINQGSKRQYSLVIRDNELCVLQYFIGSQFTVPWLPDDFPSPDIFMIVLIVVNSLLVIAVLTSRFARMFRDELHPLMESTKEISGQNLDFEVGNSKIKEFEDVLLSFSNMKDNLKTSLEQQWQAEKIQKEQIAALAHDLKTPLTVIQGNIDLLTETNLDDEQKLYSGYITDSSEQMQTYIKTLIEISRASAGYQICKRTCDTQEFLNEVETQIKALCHAKGKRLDVEISCLPNQIRIDKTLLQRAISNIVNNALDYAKENGVVKMQFKEENGRMHITVIDDGKGFSEDALRHAKEQFYMDDQSRNSKMHFGMGLYIASCIAQQHGGEIKLENSAETGGAMVTICVQS